MATKGRESQPFHGVSPRATAITFSELHLPLLNAILAWTMPHIEVYNSHHLLRPSLF
uniref:Uncharacterized protein n=1 Tax=Rhizophora mucronata TaxID=61149 RepID=A0A2P2M7T4_RHIMU